jgi:hypothetical protein
MRVEIILRGDEVEVKVEGCTEASQLMKACAGLVLSVEQRLGVAPEGREQFRRDLMKMAESAGREVH